MKQKKLIIFFPSIEKGGVEKNLFIISNFFSKKIKNIAIITSNPNEIHNKKINIITNRINIYNKSRFIKNLFCSYLLIGCSEIYGLILNFLYNCSIINS